MSERQRTVRIGCASGFWGDSQTAAAQLVEGGALDYLVFDYLAEITMGLLARAGRQDPAAGFAPDFVSSAMRPLLSEIRARGIKVVSNAGGLNPRGCRAALQACAEEAGVPLRIAVVEGDDLLATGQARRLADLETDRPLPEELLSANAYLGAKPVADALGLGADVVITGRVVDSALVLGPLVHEFAWSLQDYDRLAQGSLAGHLVECGAQCTGGNFTDWEQVPGYERMGFPVVECEAGGGFDVTKPPDTGGLLTPHTVAEQLVYEIGDPRAYLLPDVVADFSQVRLETAGADRVRVTGATGGPPTGTYKVCATRSDGYRCSVAFFLAGIDAVAKAERVAHAILTKSEALIMHAGFDSYRERSVEILGAEATYGPHARARTAREVIVKIAVAHPSKEALQLFSREIAQAATAMAPGISGFLGGRPKVSPLIRLHSTQIPRAEVAVKVDLDGQTRTVVMPDVSAADDGPSEPAAADELLDETGAQLPLVALALARSGDKGDTVNIGVIARRPEFLPYLRAALTEAAVARYMAHVLDREHGRVRRYELPGIHALNFVLEHGLAGGGLASLRIDAQGKALAQQLLEFPIPVPARLATALDTLEKG